MSEAFNFVTNLKNIARKLIAVLLFLLQNITIHYNLLFPDLTKNLTQNNLELIFNLVHSS
jgi:hypothetical protein